MGIFKKHKDIDTGRRKIAAVSKVCAPILKAVHYLSMVAALLAVIIAFIMLFVNVPPEEMMLPPFMSVHGEGADAYYSLTVGDGIRMELPYADVTTGDIKTVINAEIVLFVAYCIVIAPMALFMSKFMKDIAKGDEANGKHHRNLMFIGLSVSAGGVLIGIARSIYNYMLISGFTPDTTTVKFAIGVDFGGILIGLMIMVFSYFFGEKGDNKPVITESSREEE